MIELTTTSWFFLVDGDEIWPTTNLKLLIDCINQAGEHVLGAIVRTRNCVGDIFHYQSEVAGEYQLGGKRGHLSIRAFRKHPDYKWRGDYPLEAYSNSKGEKINDDNNRLLFVDTYYYHTTHLRRSDSNSSNRVIDRSKKYKIEIGLTVNKDELPEAIFQPRPEFVPSPFVSFTPKERVIAYFLTPLLYLKRYYRYYSWVLKQKPQNQQPKLLFLNLYSGQIQRGAESFTHELANQLADLYNVEFVKGNSSLMPQSHFTGNPFNKIRKRLFIDQPGLEVLRFTLSQISNLLSNNYDVIIPLNGFWQLLILKLLQPIKKFKIIVIGNSGPGWDERWNLYLKPDYFVATTKPTLDWAQKTWPYTHSVLIPYGVEPVKPIVKPAKINLQKPVILCPAALVPYKRIDLAIKAVSMLDSASLLVMGKGPLENKLKKLGKSLLGDRFMLTSASSDSMPSFYLASDIVTLPSEFQENSPMVFLEAMSAGKIVVATDSVRNRWMLETAGIYVDPQDLVAYSQALQLALKTKASTRKSLSKFSWTNVIKKYQHIINQCHHHH